MTISQSRSPNHPQQPPKVSASITIPKLIIAFTQYETYSCDITNQGHDLYLQILIKAIKQDVTPISNLIISILIPLSALFLMLQPIPIKKY